eukprot:3716777-Amphidinium_carterae.1
MKKCSVIACGSCISSSTVSKGARISSRECANAHVLPDIKNVRTTVCNEQLVVQAQPRRQEPMSGNDVQNLRFCDLWQTCVRLVLHLRRQLTAQADPRPVPR